MLVKVNPMSRAGQTVENNTGTGHCIALHLHSSLQQYLA